MSDPVNSHSHRADQPKQRIHEINPHRVLHAQDTAVALGVRVDVELAKCTEEHDPEDEEKGVPDEEEGDAGDEGDHVEEGCNGGQRSNNFGIDLGCC